MGGDVHCICDRMSMYVLQSSCDCHSADSYLAQVPHILFVDSAANPKREGRWLDVTSPHFQSSFDAYFASLPPFFRCLVSEV